VQILALDPSPTSTGWALEQRDGDRRSGTRDWIQAARNAGAPEDRVHHEAICLAMDFVITCYRPKIALFIEEPKFNPRRGFDIWGTGAVIAFWRAMMAAAHRAGYDRIHSVDPQEWRKAVLGRGTMASAEAKREARRWCRQFGETFSTDDEAEAKCILHYGKSLMIGQPAGELFAARVGRSSRRRKAWQSVAERMEARPR